MSKKIIKKIKDKFHSIRHKIKKNKIEIKHNKKFSKQKEQEKKNINKKTTEKVKRTVVDISTFSVIKITIIMLSVFLFFKFIVEIKEILVSLFMAFFIAMAINPAADKMQKKFKIPRGITVIFIYLLFLGIFIFSATTIIPIVAKQIVSISYKIGSFFEEIVKNDSNVPDFLIPYIENIKKMNIDDLIKEVQSNLQNLGNYLKSMAGNSISILIGIFSNIFNMIMVLVLAFFIIVDKKSVKNFAISMLPKKYHKYALEKGVNITKKIGEWLYGQILLCISVGIGIFLGLFFLGVDNAVAFGFLAGIMEAIPYVGVFIAIIPVLLVAINESLFQTVGVIIIFAIVQQLEGNLLVPLIMKKMTGLSPIVVIFSMLVGAKLMSVLGSSAILGIILSVPFATIIDLFVEEYRERNISKNKNSK